MEGVCRGLWTSSSASGHSWRERERGDEEGEEQGKRRGREGASEGGGDRI